jgi:pyruvate,water dikinase
VTLPPQRQEAEAQLRDVQEQFKRFLVLLEQNNQVLKIIGDMEEKSQGEYLFDLNYIRSSLEDIRAAVGQIIEQLVLLSDGRCRPLRQRFEQIDGQIARMFPDYRKLEPTAYVLWFDEIGREHALSVGSKNAQLGEMRSRLGMTVPNGFAVTAWAYKRFFDANGLSDRIRSLVQNADVCSFASLVEVSEKVRAMVMEARVPADLSEAIVQAFQRLVAGSSGKRVAVRSSGLEEDSLFSYAGQYATLLNVGASEAVSAYRQVVASKYTPQAIYHYLSHALGEAELAMSVGYVQMVDARASGVVYTRDPVYPDTDSLWIHAVLGLGAYLVDGTLTPDAFNYSRSDLVEQERQIVEKKVRLVLDSSGGTVQERVPDEEQTRPSVSEKELRELAQLGLRLEEHYGVPQDIEWAIDAQGSLQLLQTRPLQLVKRSTTPRTFEVDGKDVLLEGATTASPGAGAGPVYQVRTSVDLLGVNDGMVVIAPNPFPGLITIMGKARALVTEVGGVASHMATLSREYRLPTLVGASGAMGIPNGTSVTVDASGGRILAGLHFDLAEARVAETNNLFEDTPLFQGFRRILDLVAPLHMLHPSDPSFLPENCRTLHDITRYAHQKSMEEMFRRVSTLETTAEFGQPVVSELPLPVRVLYVDRPMTDLGEGKGVTMQEIDSEPMLAIWSGMREQGWPSGPSSTRTPFPTRLKTRGKRSEPFQYTVKSYAVLGTHYMMLCLHLGYHFTTIEALCTEDANKNYVRLQYKDGGASLERRVRRIRLVATLLSRLGFENQTEADFLDALYSHADCETVQDKLRLLGRITMLTKQLDMALSSDAITEWYTKDFLSKLGLES